MLNPIRLAHFDSGDLRNGVPLVGWLQGAGEEGRFRDGLGGELRVNAGGAEEEKLLDAMDEGGVNDVGLDLEIDSDEIGRVSVVSVNSADFCGGKGDELRLLGGEEGVDGGLDCEIELSVGSEDEVGEP
uniref:Uncharacterized protein n=1 Tax=Opuntia streptacantha TaxID=393608 RepID=A0A7C8YQX8_OPUST